MALNDQQRRRMLRGVVAGAAAVLDALHRVGGSLADGLEPELARSSVSRVAGATRRRLTTGAVPGAPGWAERPLDDRCRWWADRIGELTGAPATVPRLLGSVGGKLPIAAALDFAGRGLVVCAVAREIGGLDPDRQVDLVAAVTLGRTLRSDDDTGPADDHETGTGPGAADLLRSTVQLGTALHRAVGDRRDRGAGPPVPGPRLTDRVVLVGLYRSVNERKKALREVATQTIDLATNPTRPLPNRSES